MNSLISQIKKICLNLSRKYNELTIKKEDALVVNFLNKIDTKDNNLYIEIGSGLGRFVKIVKSLDKFNISCLEINSNLAEETTKLGYETMNVNLLNNIIPSNKFNIVHCSHVIEHIAYPQITQALDELIRITRKGGYIIIRSPLMSAEFFTCIDHIRPYPPKCIIDFYSNPQQQKTGDASIKIIKEKYRREALIIFPYSSNISALIVNLIMKILWICFRFPHSRPNGYTLILQKQ